MEAIKDAWKAFWSWRLRDKFYFILGVSCILWMAAMADSENGRILTFYDFIAPFIMFFGPVYLFDGVLPKLYWKYRRWQAHRSNLRYQRRRWMRTTY